MLKVQLSIEYIVLSIKIEEYSVGSGSWQGKSFRFNVESHKV